MPAITLRETTNHDLEYVERLLRENDLPYADVRAGPARFFVAHAAANEEAAEPIGCGGLEVYGDAALLRSVVVEEPRRDEGYGAAVVRALLDRAVGAGVREVFLLTTTAPDFFERRGFARVDRATAPAALRETSEFADLCPSTAVCMRRRL